MSRRKRWSIAILICIAVLFGAVGVVAHLLSGSSTGTIHVGTPTGQTSGAQEPTTITTPYFTTSLPADFNIKRQVETPTAQNLLQLLAATPATTDEQFALSYQMTPSGGMSQSGDYNLRAIQTQTYRQFTPPNLPAGAVAFRTAQSPPSFTVFWPHGTHYAELSVSTDGVASLDQLEAVLSQVISSWQWK